MLKKVRCVKPLVRIPERDRQLDRIAISVSCISIAVVCAITMSRAALQMTAVWHLTIFNTQSKFNTRTRYNNFMLQRERDCFLQHISDALMLLQVQEVNNLTVMQTYCIVFMQD